MNPSSNVPLPRVDSPGIGRPVAWEVVLLLLAAAGGAWLAFHPPDAEVDNGAVASTLLLTFGLVVIQGAMFWRYLKDVREVDRQERESAQVSLAATRGRSDADFGGDVIGDAAASGANSLLVLGVGISAAGLLLWGLLGASSETLLAGIPRAFLSTGLAVFSGLNLSGYGRAALRAYRADLRALLAAHAAAEAEARKAEEQLRASAERAEDPVLVAQRDFVTRLEKAVSRLETLRPEVHVTGGAETLLPTLREQVAALRALAGGTPSDPALANALSTLGEASRDQGASLRKLVEDSAALVTHAKALSDGAQGIQLDLPRLVTAAGSAAKSTDEAGKQASRLADLLGQGTEEMLKRHADVIRQDTLVVTRAAMAELVTAASGPVQSTLAELKGQVLQQTEAAHNQAHDLARQRLEELHTAAQKGLTDSAKGVKDATDSLDRASGALRSMTTAVDAGSDGLAKAVPRYQEATEQFGASAEAMLQALARGVAQTAPPTAPDIVGTLDRAAHSMLGTAERLTAATALLSATVESLAAHLTRQEEARRRLVAEFFEQADDPPTNPTLPAPRAGAPDR